jgi:hypothetical protein
MPRTCLACSSSDRAEIDKALVAGEPLRNIAERVSISRRLATSHKPPVSQAIVKAADQQEDKHGLDLLVERERAWRKAWELLSKMEAEGDHRGSVVALREARECLETLGSLLSGANGVSLASASDGDILAEAERSKLPMGITFNVVETSAPTRQDKVLDVEPGPES